jgi:CRISPR/Cas system-associated exonuclease Cas4 (RecB family)
MIATVDSVQVHSPAQPPKVIVKANPIETLQKTVSASRLNTWLQCRLKFYFRYVQEIPKPKTPSLHVGSVVHVVLQAWNMARWRKQAFNRDTFKKLFEEGWKDQPPGINWDVEGLAREDFVPSPGFHCAGCEFFSNCKSWCQGGDDADLCK